MLFAHWLALPLEAAEHREPYELRDVRIRDQKRAVSSTISRAGIDEEPVVARRTPVLPDCIGDVGADVMLHPAGQNVDVLSAGTHHAIGRAPRLGIGRHRRGDDARSRGGSQRREHRHSDRQDGASHQRRRRLCSCSTGVRRATTGSSSMPARRFAGDRSFLVPDPYVNLSIYTAPDVRPFPWQSRQWARSIGFCSAQPFKPVSRPLGVATQPLELAARPADDIEIDPL